jgi:hypothetical protein
VGLPALGCVRFLVSPRPAYAGNFMGTIVPFWGITNRCNDRGRVQRERTRTTLSSDPTSELPLELGH